MSKLNHSLIQLTFLLGLGGALHADTVFSFKLLPENQSTNTAVSLYAPPGSTVGWGYFLQNLDDLDYLMILDVQPTINFLYGTADSFIFDFPILAPGAQVTVPWLRDLAGLYQFTSDSDAPAFTQDGQFVITATWYTEDPSACNYECTEQFQTQTQELVPFSVSSTPEPSGSVTAGSALLGAGLFLLVRRRLIVRN